MDAERDFLIRTVLGEAARQGEAGQAAVAHVILNRAKAGNYGGASVREVVTAANQFEPWGSEAGRRRMYSYQPGTPAYDRAAQIVDGVMTGRIADPTGGATHFLNEEIVRQRRGGSLPRWADQMSGTAHRIGDHTFYGGAKMARPQFDPEKFKRLKAEAGTGGQASPYFMAGRPDPKPKQEDTWRVREVPPDGAFRDGEAFRVDDYKIWRRN